MTKTQATLVIVVLFAILVAASANVIVNRRSQVIKWEYKIEGISDLEFERKMQTLGEEGWELTFARRALGSETFGEKSSLYECIFRRPK